MRVKLSTDGGARGNPGPAAYGYVLDIPRQIVALLRQAHLRVSERPGLHRVRVLEQLREPSREHRIVRVLEVR